MSTNYSYAGQFTFDKVKIFASSGTIIDVSRLVTGLNIYEDLYNYITFYHYIKTFSQKVSSGLITRIILLITSKIIRL